MSIYERELALLYASLPADGDIIELGVAQGRNALRLGVLGANDRRHYWGFDTFKGYPPEDLHGQDHLLPNQRSGRWNIDPKTVQATLRDAGLAAVCSLVIGDLKQTLPPWLAETPRHISWLYVDCNAYKPSIRGMQLVWPALVPGGIISVDEHVIGGETQAIVDFADQQGLTVIETGFTAGPLRYVRKPR